MNDESISRASDLGAPPRMFELPTDAPTPLTPIRGAPDLVRIHDQWKHLNASVPTEHVSPSTRLVRRIRSGSNRLLGRSDHEFLADLVRAIDVVAARCDDIADQLARQQLLTQNIAEALGEEITRLRAAALDDRSDDAT